MEWYFVLLIVLGGVFVLFWVLTFVVAALLLKATTKPKAYTLQESRAGQASQENVDFFNYDNVWQKQPFAVDGTRGKICGEVVFNPSCPKQQSKVAVLCHGHTTNRMHAVKYAQIFYDLGYNVIVYDHAYFGLSDGDFTTIGYYERHDLSVVLDYARSIFGQDAIVALQGESMGAVTVLSVLQLRNDVNLVVADCPFSNTTKYYKQLFSHLFRLPCVPVVAVANVLSKAKYGYDFNKLSPIDVVSKSNVPICFIHGEQDKFICPEHSVAMSKASLSADTELHLFPNAKHATSYVSDKPHYTKVVSAFVQKVQDKLL